MRPRSWSSSHGHRGDDDDDDDNEDDTAGPVATRPSGVRALRRRWRSAVQARQAAARRAFAAARLPLLAGLSAPCPAAVSVAYDARMLLHEEVTRPRRPLLPGVPAPPRVPHVERGDRLACVAQHLVATGLFQRCARVPSRRARVDEVLLCHSDAHLARVDSLRLADHEGQRIGADTFANEHTHTAAFLAAGSVLAVTESVMRGETRSGIALVRPPGHHAEPDSIMGFCLLNNAAIAAAVARRHLGARRVLILDWDVHHGNGTQACFVDDPSVMYVSVHRFEPGFFPGTGSPTSVGVGRGAGRTVNVGWRCGGMRDADYAAAFDSAIMPIARQFDPDLVIVSAGFDAAVDDPLGGCLVTPAGFAMMTSRLRELAFGRMVVALEGGYNLAAIALCTEAVTRVLLGEPAPPFPDTPSLRPPRVPPPLPLHGHSHHHSRRAAVPSSPAFADPLARSGSRASDAAGDSRRFGTHLPQQAAVESILRTIDAQAPYWPGLRRVRAGFFASAVHTLRQRQALLLQDKEEQADDEARRAADHRPGAGPAMDSLPAFDDGSSVGSAAMGSGLAPAAPAPPGASDHWPAPAILAVSTATPTAAPAGLEVPPPTLGHEAMAPISSAGPPPPAPLDMIDRPQVSFAPPPATASWAEHATLDDGPTPRPFLPDQHPLPLQSPSFLLGRRPLHAAAAARRPVEVSADELLQGQRLGTFDRPSPQRRAAAPHQRHEPPLADDDVGMREAALSPRPEKRPSDCLAAEPSPKRPAVA